MRIVTTRLLASKAARNSFKACSEPWWLDVGRPTQRGSWREQLADLDRTRQRWRASSRAKRALHVLTLRTRACVPSSLRAHGRARLGRAEERRAQKPTVPPASVSFTPRRSSVHPAAPVPARGCVLPGCGSAGTRRSGGSFALSGNATARACGMPLRRASIGHRMTARAGPAYLQVVDHATLRHGPMDGGLALSVVGYGFASTNYVRRLDR